MIRIAVTMMMVAVAIYVAARLIEAVAPVLIACSVLAAVTYTGILIFRYRRGRW